MAIQLPVDPLVLGRGINKEGILSPTGVERSKVAVQIARMLVPKVVVFSGGHSWRQELTGAEMPSEGDAMLAYAQEYMGTDIPPATQFLAEGKSTSTVENMVNSKPLLGLSENQSSLGILSDGLHFSQGRIEFLAGLVFPGSRICPFYVAKEETPEAVREEKLITIMTKAFMIGVRAGDSRAIMRRQRGLESVNAVYRRVFAMLGGK